MQQTWIIHDNSWLCIVLCKSIVSEGKPEYLIGQSDFGKSHVTLWLLAFNWPIQYWLFLHWQRTHNTPCCLHSCRNLPNCQSQNLPKCSRLHRSLSPEMLRRDAQLSRCGNFERNLDRFNIFQLAVIMVIVRVQHDRDSIVAKIPIEVWSYVLYLTGVSVSSLSLPPSDHTLLFSTGPIPCYSVQYRGQQ